MAKTGSFTKRALISKASSTMVMATAVAAFVVVFAGVASKALFSQAAYQNKVISQKKKALSTLKGDISAVGTLKSSYKSFVETPRNVLGGNPTGTGDQDGDNAKIVLDAMPSKYDFPALTASLEKLISAQGLQIQSVTGTDQEVQQANQASPSPKPVAVPFQIRVSGSYDGIKNLLSSFERSIRPIQIKKVEVDAAAQGGSMVAIIDAQTFYQPEKTLTIKSEVVQ